MATARLAVNRRVHRSKGRGERIVVQLGSDSESVPAASLLRGLLFGVPISLALWGLLLWALL